MNQLKRVLDRIAHWPDDYDEIKMLQVEAFAKFVLADTTTSTQIDQALLILDKAVESGYDHYKLMQEFKDFIGGWE